MSIFGYKKREKRYLEQIEEYEKKIQELQQETNRLNEMLSPEHKDIEKLKREISELKAQKSNLLKEFEKNKNGYVNLKNQIQYLSKVLTEKKNEIVAVNNEIEMQSYGIYTPTYEFSNSSLYKDELKRIRDKQKELIKENQACNGNENWIVNNNAAKGRKMVKDVKKLLLRAFNLECDDIVKNVKISNFEKSKERIYKASNQISKLGSVWSISFSQDYINLKIAEVSIALDFAQKKQEEKEKIRELKEQQREEAKAQKEIEAARKKLQKEQSHYQNALKMLNEQLEKDSDNKDLLAKKEELELNIEDTNKAIADVDYREANKRAGYVYIISNIGAFGENIFKIGMTRRLDPTERVNELGDASVPFKFDIHALIFSEDAPALESALHKAFESKKLNKINQRREFFNVTLEEIKSEVKKNFDKTVEWIDIPEAEQYRQSILL